MTMLASVRRKTIMSCGSVVEFCLQGARSWSCRRDQKGSLGWRRVERWIFPSGRKWCDAGGMSISSTIDVDHHQFFLCAMDADPTSVSSRGDVFDSGDNLVAVHTGIASGPAQISLSALMEPAADDFDSWDNVNQATLAVNQPLVVLTTLGDVESALGTVETPHAGYLTVRVSVRGRATNWDLNVEEPSEEYLIETWTGHARKSVAMVKSTDGIWSDHVDEAPRGKAPRVDPRVSDATVRLRGPVRWDSETMPNVDDRRQQRTVE